MMIFVLHVMMRKDMTNFNKLFSYLILALFAETILLSFVYDTYLAMFLIGLPTVSICLYMLKNQPSAALTRHTVALGAMVFACLHIHQMNGLIEIHFELFILLAFLIVMHDWRVYISTLLLVGIHHMSFYLMQTNDMGVFVFSEDRLVFSNVILHAVYFAIECAVAGYIAKTLNDEGVVGEQLAQAATQIMGDGNSVDLKYRVQEHNNPVLQDFNKLISTLDTVISEIQEQSNQFLSNAQNLLEARNELQASSDVKQAETNTIATSAEEMAVTVSSIAQDTHQLSESIESANEKTTTASSQISHVHDKNTQLAQQLKETGDNISHLANSSATISKVLSEITSIAEQTNLLALNAAIEAARAGEQGRGFAVVADEVRALANRTKDSTNRVSETLASLENYSQRSTQSMAASIEVVDAILTTVEDAHIQIGDASQLVSLSNDLSVNVASAVQEQSSTTQEIANSSEALRRSVQADIDKVAVVSTEAENISESCEKMSHSIASFK